MLGFLLKLINPLGRILDTIDRNTDVGLERERARLAAMQVFVREQAAIMQGPSRWFLWLFIAPLGFWFAAVCVYSVLWCQGCAFPQNWTVAALPKPLDEWAGYIITSLFVGGFAVQSVKLWKR